MFIKDFEFWKIWKINIFEKYWFGRLLVFRIEQKQLVYWASRKESEILCVASFWKNTAFLIIFGMFSKSSFSKKNMNNWKLMKKTMKKQHLKSVKKYFVAKYGSQGKIIVV